MKSFFLTATHKRREFLKKSILVFVIFHYAMVLLGALEFQVFKTGFLSLAEEIYGDFTGSYGQFKFFAPNVTPDPRVVIEVHRQDGSVVEFELHETGNDESELRMRSVIALFWDEADNEQMRRAISASWAGRTLARYPDSKSVVVKVQSYDLPTMEEWRRGMKPAWQDYYRAKYNRPQS